MLIVYLGGILMIDISKLIKAEYECIDNQTDSTSGRPKDKPGDTIMTLW